MLTEVQCKNATCPPDKKRQRLTDAGGLYLEVSPGGSKRWFWKTYADGKEGRLALGGYPDVTLKGARLARDAAKKDRAAGVNLVQARKIAKLKSEIAEGDTFKATALEWFCKNKSRWSSHYAIREQRNLEKDLFPYFAERRVGEIEPIELLSALRRVEERGALDVASRVLQTARAVWRYAIATARASRDITADLKGALTPHKKRHFAAITDPKKLGELLRVIRGYQGGPIVRAALQLAPILFQRPNELRGATWAEIDLENALWTVPAARMKRRIDGKENGDPHLVPLPTQAVEILRKLHPISGHGVMVFPGERSHDRPISDNTLRAALLTLGYGPTVQTVHGFRATARTLLAEVVEIDPLVIEAQLAHAVKDANGRAYNRTQYLKQRADMMQRWSDYLDKLAAGADVIPLRPAA
ncbi:MULTISPECIES: site-specific integrase [unclassified Variovorax]|uniref:tyrosine-type recombinase/integrase n=1 Tax=unclassified Variovorax TaxID=663243 RepID=UPI00076CA4F1|nr:MULTISPECIES: site-specific integrase [unclassified Variovorax]KWT97548.1 Integrase [Variovorax sp. WDL1]PNG56005.1 putative prophage CPS-53 integrase [Variovorax sp. B4]PNG57429.1 putative prophage CPS-53 integrase [Variovorax sp. B2]VTV10198.1 Putative prophage CPS-53 integrase [Variovorax sp. WDL1]